MRAPWHAARSAAHATRPRACAARAVGRHRRRTRRRAQDAAGRGRPRRLACAPPPRPAAACGAAAALLRRPPAHHASLSCMQVGARSGPLPRSTTRGWAAATTGSPRATSRPAHVRGCWRTGPRCLLSACPRQARVPALRPHLLATLPPSHAPPPQPWRMWWTKRRCPARWCGASTPSACEHAAGLLRGECQAELCARRAGPPATRSCPPLAAAHACPCSAQLQREGYKPSVEYITQYVFVGKVGAAIEGLRRQVDGEAAGRRAGT